MLRWRMERWRPAVEKTGRRHKPTAAWVRSHSARAERPRPEQGQGLVQHGWLPASPTSTPGASDSAGLGWGRGCAFLTSFQVLLLLLGREAHLEKRCARALHAGIETLATHRGQQGSWVGCWGVRGREGSIHPVKRDQLLPRHSLWLPCENVGCVTRSSIWSGKTENLFIYLFIFCIKCT